MIDKKLPAMKDMVAEARRLNIYYQEMDKTELFFALAGVSDKEWYDDVYTHMRAVTVKEEERLKEEKRAIPAKCIWPAVYENQVLEILSHKETKNGFYNFNYWDKEKTTHYVFDRKKARCWCGKRLDFKRHYTKGKIPHTESVDIQTCPECGKRYIYLKVNA